MKSIYSLFVRGYQVNQTETNRKGLTELSEINLARPFLLVFLICIVFSFPFFTQSVQFPAGLFSLHFRQYVMTSDL